MPFWKMAPSTTSTTEGSAPLTKCWVDDRSYEVGDRVFKSDACEICYCMNNGIECDKITCDTEEEHGCVPKFQDGECCPVAYDCTNLTNAFEEDRPGNLTEHMNEVRNLTINSFDRMNSTMKTGNKSESNEEYSGGIHVSDTELNDTVLAIMLERVFGPGSDHNGSEEAIYPNFNVINPFSGTNNEDNTIRETYYVTEERNHSKVEDQSSTEDGGDVTYNGNSSFVYDVKIHPLEDGFEMENEVSSGNAIGSIKLNETRHQTKIKPVFLDRFLVEDLNLGKNDSDGEKSTGSSTSGGKEFTVINGTKEGVAQQASRYQPLFINTKDIDNLNSLERPSGEEQLEASPVKPVRENDRLIDFLNVHEVLRHQFNLRKIPPVVLPTRDLAGAYPIYRKHIPAALRKKRPPSRFEPPPTLPPKLVASILSMFRASAHQINNRIHRGQAEHNAGIHEGFRPVDNKEYGIRKRSRKEDSATSDIVKPNIQFIPFVAADAVGKEANASFGWSSKKPSGQAQPTTTEPGKRLN